MSRLKLFAFPYAGGSSSIYNGLRPLLDDQIEFIPVELAGRGRRIGEDLYPDLNAAVDDLYKIVSPQIGFSQFAFFGHSMGSLLAHQLAKRLKEELGVSPSHIFFSGRGALQMNIEKEKKYHQMSEQQFKDEVLLLGGTPPEFFQHPELLELFLPLLRNDFRIAETAPSIDGFNKEGVDITVFTGREDDHTEEQIAGWNDYTTGSCEIHTFEGGHFFIHQEMDAIARIINSTIDQLVIK
ncbi:thioesterase [Fulvivirga sp. 29W222]|uniref:Thioesterase n=1 Tax=Fulvivirga marina TaxID=2494733 RepID=A0A937KGW6_9BACT|nr:alpha/beta fold hydrolase [Fulvivirga marina]MBL6449598.1 thioesterase [Fulvivirga marina]